MVEIKEIKIHINVKTSLFTYSYIIVERYDYVGKLLKPGEAPTNYSDEEDEGSQLENEARSKHD